MIGSIITTDRQHEKDVSMTKFTIEGQQIDTLCSFNLMQQFKNKGSSTAELSYEFPNDSKFCVYDTTFVVNGRTIKPQLRSKEEAKKEYEEAKRAGHSAIHGENVGNGINRFKLGNLEAGKDATIELKVSFLADVTPEGTYFKFPLTAKYQEGPVTSALGYSSESFSFDLKLVGTKGITKTEVSIPGDVKIVDQCTQTFSTKVLPNVDAIFIKTQTPGGGKSTAISSNGFIHLSTYFDFKAPPSKSNCEFVFLVDCSGSMSGSSITNASSCMKIFVKSLPVGCKFSIWRFGSTSECMIPSSDYTKETSKMALDCISNLRADLGGTNILNPLKQIIAKEPPQGYVRQIFVLTDGEVDDTDIVLATVQQGRNTNRIFSVGLGSGADAGLVNGLATSTQGNSIIVNEGSTLSEKVISLLESSLSPGLPSPSIIADSLASIWPSPIPSLYSHSSQHFIIKAPHQESILVSGDCGSIHVDEVVEVKAVEGNVGLGSLFSSKAIEDLEYYLVLNPSDSEKKSKVIEMSISSNVLSKYTSYIGIDFLSHVRQEIELCECLCSCNMQCSYAMCDAELEEACDDDNFVSCDSFDSGFNYAPSCLREPIEYEKCECESDDFSLCSSDCALGMVFSDISAPKEEGFSKDTHLSQMKEIVDLDLDLEEKEAKPASISQTKKEIDVDFILEEQNPDGSWDSFHKVDSQLVQKYGIQIASTICSLAFLYKFGKDQMGSLKLIIKKALDFLNSQQAIDWMTIIKNAENGL